MNASQLRHGLQSQVICRPKGDGKREKRKTERERKRERESAVSRRGQGSPASPAPVERERERVRFHADQQTTDSAVARERRGARGTSFSKRRASKQAREGERE